MAAWGDNPSAHSYRPIYVADAIMALVSRRLT